MQATVPPPNTLFGLPRSLSARAAVPYGVHGDQRSKRSRKFDATDRIERVATRRTPAVTGSRRPTRLRGEDGGVVASSHETPQFVPPQRHDLRAGGAAIDVRTARPDGGAAGRASSRTRRPPGRRSMVGGAAPPPRTRKCCVPGGKLTFRSPGQGESPARGTKGAAALCGSTCLQRKFPAWRATGKRQIGYQSSQSGAAHAHECAQDARPARLGGAGRASSPVRRSRPPVGIFRRMQSAFDSSFSRRINLLGACYD